MSDIMNCPFCGSNAMLKTTHNSYREKYYTFIRCSGCGAQTRPYITDTEPKEVPQYVLNAWNMRYNEDQPCIPEQ